MSEPEDPQEKTAELSPDEQSFHQHLVALATGGALIAGVNVRQFSLTNGKSILGFLIKELTDSFLVVLPTSLQASDSGDISASLITTPTTCRFMKSHIMMTTVASDLPLLYYLLSVEDHYPACAGFFTEKRITRIAQVVKELKKRFGVVSLVPPEKPSAKKSDRDISDIADLEKMSDAPFVFSSRTKH